jgi:mRNA interferase HigB
LARRNNFDNLIELKAVFLMADWVSERVVFNLGSYRLICGVSFRRQTLFFKALLSHAEYDKGGWKS